MRTTIKVVLALLLGAAVVAAYFIFRGNRFRTPVEVIFTVSVSPADQMDFVMGQARSAKIKYDAAKKAGMKTALAQRLSVSAAPSSAVIELKAGTESRDEARHFVEAFVELLNARCEGKAQAALVSETIR